MTAQRAAITVVLKNGTRYDASVLNLVFEDHSMRPMLSFVSSGRQHVVQASAVERLHWSSSGATWCTVCDQPLPAWVQAEVIAPVPVPTPARDGGEARATLPLYHDR